MKERFAQLCAMDDETLEQLAGPSANDFDGWDTIIRILIKEGFDAKEARDYVDYYVDNNLAIMNERP